MASKQHQDNDQEEKYDEDDEVPPELVALPLPSSSFSPNKPPSSSAAPAAPAQDANQPLPSSNTGPSTTTTSKVVPVTIITGFLGAGT